MFTLDSKSNKDIKELHKKMAEVEKILEEKMAELPREIQSVLFAGGNDIRNTIVQSMTHTRRKHFGHTVKRGDELHWPSAPGHPPAVDSGELRRSIIFDVRGTEMEVGSYAGAPYAKFLEKGTRKMRARPFLEPAVEENKNEILNNIAQIAENLFLNLGEKK